MLLKLLGTLRPRLRRGRRAHRPREPARRAAVHLGRHAPATAPAATSSPASGCSARPGWTTPPRWRPCAPSPVTSQRSCLHDPRPEGHALNDYYQDLGVGRDAGTEDIKRAYRRLARKLHPDVNPGPEAEEQFKKVSQAYDVLSDPEKRRAYDAGADPYGDAAAGGFGQGFSFSDIMDAFFTSPGAGGGRGPALAPAPRPGRADPPRPRPVPGRVRCRARADHRHRRRRAAPATVTAPSRAPAPAPATSAAAAARCSRCSAPSSAR